MSSLENLLSQGVVERLGWMLVHMLWQAAAVALLLAGLLRLLRRADASLRYLTACAALVLIVALPVATLPFIAVAGPAAEAGPSPLIRHPAVVPPTTVQVVDQMPTLSRGPVPLEPADLTMPVSWRERITSTLEPVLPYLVLGWLVGVFGLSAWHLGGWAQLQRMRRRMVRQVGPALQATLAELGARLGVHQAVTLLESAIVDVPAVVGWLRPVILLPASALSGLPPEQLEAILAHELAHIRRHDYLVNILQTIAEILGFYHPAVWWVSRRIRVERENCCDDLAVRISGDSVRYARALSSMEEIRHSRAELAVAAAGGSLIERIARLLGRRTTDERLFTWLGGLVALLLVIGLIVPAALVLAAPDVPLARSRVDSQPNDSGQARRIPAAEAASDPRAGEEQQEPLQILINFSFFPKVSPHTMVDRETRLLIGEILTAENPQVLEDIADLNSKQNLTLGEILRTWIAGRSLAPESAELLIDVLQSRGYLEGEATPQVLVKDNSQAQINIVTEEAFLPSTDPASSPTLIELGTSLQVTPHLASLTSDRITLEMALKWRERAKQDDRSDAPAVRVTEIASTVTIPRNRYFTLLVEPDNVRNPETADSELLLVMFRADRHETGTKQESPSIAQAQPSESHPRQVLLDVRVVVMERQDLGLLGVEWGNTTTWVGGSLDATPWTGGRVGYTPDRALTDRLLATLSRLEEAGRANILAHPQLLAQEGRESRIKAITEEWFVLPVSATDESSPARRELVKIDSGTTISVTPRLGDANNITLDTAIELSHSIPQDEGADLPVVTRRTARNTVTIRDGGTVALAGLKENQVAEDKSAKDFVVFVTARSADGGSGSGAPEPATQGAVRIEPQTNVAPQGTSQSHVLAPGDTDANDQVLSEFIIAKVRPATKVKPQTATELARLLNRPLKSIEGSSVGQLLQETANMSPAKQFAAVVNLLDSGRYIEVLSKPSVVTYTGQPAQMHMGGDPNAVKTGETPFGLTLGVVAQKSTDRQTIQLDLDIDLQLTKVLPTPPGWTGAPQDRPVSVQEVATQARLEAPEGRYVIQPLAGLTQGPAADPNSEAIYLMLTAALTTAGPPGAAGPMMGQVKEPEEAIETVAMRRRTEANESRDPQDDKKGQVAVEMIIADVLADERLDVETAISIEGILGERVRPEGQRFEPGQRLGMTLGEVLKKHVEGRPLPEETVRSLRDLLASRGAMKSLSSPRITVLDGEQALIQVVDMRSVPVAAAGGDPSVPAKVEMVECGIRMTITPHIGDRNDVTLDFGVQVTDLAPPPQGGGLPSVRRRMAEIVFTVPSGLCFVHGTGAGTSETANTTDGRSLYVVIKASVVKPDGKDTTRSSEEKATDTTGTVASEQEPAIQPGVPASGDDLSPEQVIRARTEYVHSDPIFRELARHIVEIERELIADSQKFAPGNPEMVRKRAILDALKKRMDERKENLRQEFDDQLAEQSETRVDVRSQEAPKSVITATFTDAELREVLAEISRRAAVRITADDTVKSQAITVELVDASVETALQRILDATPYAFKKIGATPDARRGQTQITMTFLGDDLRPVLYDLATVAGVPILTDETVAGPVYAELKDVALDQALEIILAGTPYVIEKTAEYYLVTTGRGIVAETPVVPPRPQGGYLVYRPIQMRFMNFPRRQALLDVAAIAGISVAVSENVTGSVSADLQGVPLDTAFGILLAGTPYVVEKKADDYHIVERRTPRGSSATTTDR